MKLPADGDALDKAARALVRKLKRKPEIFDMSDTRPRGIDGRLLRGKKLEEYREHGFITVRPKRPS